MQIAVYICTQIVLHICIMENEKAYNVIENCIAEYIVESVALMLTEAADELQ